MTTRSRRKRYRLVILVKGQADQQIEGPWTFDKDEVENDLKVISAAQAGSNALVSLPWVVVREGDISAAHIVERWSSSAAGF